jgi:hypothetical protein
MHQNAGGNVHAYCRWWGVLGLDVVFVKQKKEILLIVLYINILGHQKRTGTYCRNIFRKLFSYLRKYLVTLENISIVIHVAIGQKVLV